MQQINSNGSCKFSVGCCRMLLTAVLQVVQALLWHVHRRHLHTVSRVMCLGGLETQSSPVVIDGIMTVHWHAMRQLGTGMHRFIQLHLESRPVQGLLHFALFSSSSVALLTLSSIFFFISECQEDNVTAFEQAPAYCDLLTFSHLPSGRHCYQCQ